MKLPKILVLALTLLLSGNGFSQENNALESGFGTLVKGKWVWEGQQLGGQDGRTEYWFEFGLDGKLVKVKTFTTDPETGVFELRNEGVRAWDSEDSLYHFYEFDKHGGVTTGFVTINGKTIDYDYEYQGATLRDHWEYVDENTYKMVVGIWEGDSWGHIFAEFVLTRKKK